MATIMQHWVLCKLETRAHPQAFDACNKMGTSAIAACINKLQKPEFNYDKTLLILEEEKKNSNSLFSIAD